MWYKNTKYGSKKVTYDGMVFDSKGELQRYQDLKILEKCGIIQNLRRQVKFVLIPTQREPDIIGKRGGVKQGKVIEKECSYTADFVYEENGQLVVEDYKGYKTEAYKIKKKLMLYMHGIRIKEVKYGKRKN